MTNLLAIHHWSFVTRLSLLKWRNRGCELQGAEAQVDGLDYVLPSLRYGHFNRRHAVRRIHGLQRQPLRTNQNELVGQVHARFRKD